MRFRIQTVTGEIFTSDLMTEKELANLKMTEEEAIAQGQKIFEHFDDLEYLSLEMSGRKRFFNPKNVVWGEIID